MKSKLELALYNIVDVEMRKDARSSIGITTSGESAAA